MVLYGITLVPLAKGLRDVNLEILSPFYANYAEFNGSVHQNPAQLKIMMEWGPDRGCFPEPGKSIFIAGNPEKREAANR